MRQQLAPHRLLTIVAALVVLYGLALISFPYLVTQLPVQSWIRDRVLARWEERLGITMDFAEMRPAGLGQLEITDVTLTADGAALAQVEKIVIKADLAGLLLALWQPTEVISWVKLISPEVTVDRADLSAWQVMMNEVRFTSEAQTMLTGNLPCSDRQSRHLV